MGCHGDCYVFYCNELLEGCEGAVLFFVSEEWTSE